MTAIKKVEVIPSTSGQTPTSTEKPIVVKDSEPGVSSQYKEHRPLYEHFGIREGYSSTSRADDALAKIWQFAKAQAPAKDKDSIVFEVIKWKNKLGSPNLGDKPWAKLEIYATVWLQARKAEEQLQELEQTAKPV